MKKYILILLPFLLFLLACEKEIKFKGKDVNSKIVVNARISTDSVWAVHISKSLSILDKAKPSVLSLATVKIQDMQGNTIEELSYTSDGIYVSSTGKKPEAGKSYKLQVSHTGYETVYAECFFPNPVSITQLDTGKAYFRDNEYMRLRLRLNDPMQEENFYMIRAHIGHMQYVYDEFGQVIDSVYSYYSEGLMSTTLYMEYAGGDSENGYDLMLFTRDNLYNGQQVEFDIYLNYYLFNSFEGYKNDIFLEFISAGKDYYLHTLSKRKYDLVQGNPFAEPVMIYSNIENGIGIFGGYSAFMLQLH